MNMTHRILIVTTLAVLAGGASAAEMQDEIDATKPDLRTSAAVVDKRGARLEDVIDRPAIMRSTSERQVKRPGSRSSRTDSQPRKPLPKRTKR
jgi:hypothetical protein